MSSSNINESSRVARTLEISTAQQQFIATDIPGAVLNYEADEQLDTVNALFATVAAIRHTQMATDAAQKESRRTIEEQTQAIMDLEAVNREQSEKLGLLNTHTNTMLVSLAANDQHLTKSRDQIAILATTPTLPNPIPLILATGRRTHSCFQKFRALTWYPCIMLGTGTTGAVTTGLIFKTTLAATLGGLGGAVAGGAGFYIIRHLKKACFPVPLIQLQSVSV